MQYKRNQKAFEKSNHTSATPGTSSGLLTGSETPMWRMCYEPLRRAEYNPFVNHNEDVKPLRSLHAGPDLWDYKAAEHL